MKNEQQHYIVPLNLSKLGFRYFRIVLEAKLFSKKFINYLINHPNTGFVFVGSGWSGKKQVLGVGIWATNNAEMSDIATNIRSVIPASYKVVYQSELTRLEYFNEVDGCRRSMLLIDELDQKRSIDAIEHDYLKLISIDGSLSMSERATFLGISLDETKNLNDKLLAEKVFYGVFLNDTLADNYVKFFVDTTALSYMKVEAYCETLRNDPNCVYLARGNGRYNLEFEYIMRDEKRFVENYKPLLSSSKKVSFHTNVYTNLFPQSKFLNTKMIQKRFAELAAYSRNHFDFNDSELWYVNHDGTQNYLNIYEDTTYYQTMTSGEMSLFNEVSEHLIRGVKKYNVIDLGSGNGKKGRELTKSLGEENVKAYFPVDIQELELSQAVVAHNGAAYTIFPTVIGFANLDARFPLTSAGAETNLYALLGATYGNFDSCELNKSLKPLLASPSDRLLISVSIRDFVTKESIIDSYTNMQVENMAFGVLRQIGFTKNEFVPNNKHPELKLHLKWEGDRLRTMFVLGKDKHLLGLTIEAGTTFTITSSWKPMLVEFRDALSRDFHVERMISNRSFAIAVCKRKNG